MNPCPRTDSDLDERWLALDNHLTAGARGWCSCSQPYPFPCLPLNPASKIIIMLGGTRVSCWGLFHVQDRSQYGFPPATASGCLVCGGQCSVSCCCLTYQPRTHRWHRTSPAIFMLVAPVDKDFRKCTVASACLCPLTSGDSAGRPKIRSELSSWAPGSCRSFFSLSSDPWAQMTPGWAPLSLEGLHGASLSVGSRTAIFGRSSEGHVIQGTKTAADLSLGNESQLIWGGIFFFFIFFTSTQMHKINWQWLL